MKILNYDEIFLFEQFILFLTIIMHTESCNVTNFKINK